MYEDGNGIRLSCFYLVADIAAETEFQFREQNGVSAFYWVDDGLAYAIAANAGRDRLLKLAEIVYRQNFPDGTKNQTAARARQKQLNIPELAIFSIPNGIRRRSASHTSLSVVCSGRNGGKACIHLH